MKNKSKEDARAYLCLCVLGAEQDAIDILYENVDQMMHKKDWTSINDLIDLFLKIGIVELIEHQSFTRGLLSITSHAKENLPKRDDLIKNIQRYYNSSIPQYLKCFID